MKKIFWILFLGYLSALVVLKADAATLKDPSRLFYVFPCDTAIRYRINTVDPRFNITHDQLKKDLEQAAGIWRAVEGKQLFLYDEKGELKVNLIYDDRQSLNLKINNLEGELQTDEKSIAPEINDYKKRAADFDKKLTELNNQIQSWNEKGGAPPEIYKQLKESQTSLQQEAQTLNEMAKKLNMATDQYNQKVGEFNQTVQTFKNTLQERPEEGLYDSGEQKIDIYITNSQNELIHTLAHEMGHALGIEHVENKDAIMYPYTNQVITPAPEDITELQEVCRKRSLFEVTQTRFIQLYAFLSQKYGSGTTAE